MHVFDAEVVSYEGGVVKNVLVAAGAYLELNVGVVDELDVLVDLVDLVEDAFFGDYGVAPDDQFLQELQMRQALQLLNPGDLVEAQVQGLQLLIVDQKERGAEQVAFQIEPPQRVRLEQEVAVLQFQVGKVQNEQVLQEVEVLFEGRQLRGFEGKDAVAAC